MGISYLIMTMNPSQTIFNADTFIIEGHQKWPNVDSYRWEIEGNGSDAALDVHPPTASSFIIDHFHKDHMISVDGTPEQAAEVAAWVRSLLPNPNLDLWILDNHLSGHTVLFPGITPEQVLDNWVDHREHDPYIEYPQYFH
ncbi:hypothetical protein J5X07_12670 [Actinomyces bowdenii]|uniref:hypothetical protein n=1 Tax=Actinomyces bowdenii TaxID=131109 RepID=UPI001ABCE715|nr:hypothetical protein [Actinomyces bowdenii]MBO3725862.1 hypothetical protein [Actinomyces bowdenii]